MSSECYSSGKNGPLPLCHGRSLIGEFACASDVAPLDLTLLSLLRPHCYPSRSLTHTTRRKPSLSLQRRLPVESSGTSRSPWLLTRQPRLLSLSSEMLQLSPRDTGQHGRSEDGAS
jgi:hypothetical protein